MEARRAIVADKWNKRIGTSAIVSACQRKVYATLNSMQVDRSIAPILDEELEIIKNEFSRPFSF